MHTTNKGSARKSDDAFERQLEMDAEVRITNAYHALNGLIELCNAAFQETVNPENFGLLLQYIQNDLGDVVVGTKAGVPSLIRGRHSAPLAGR